jgi:hypothetical protein
MTSAAPTSHLPPAEHNAAITAICNELTYPEIFDDQIADGSDAAFSVRRLAGRTGLTVVQIEHQVFEELPHVLEVNELDRMDFLPPQDDGPVQH